MLILRVFTLTIALTVALIGRANAQSCSSLFTSIEDQTAEQDVSFVKKGSVYDLRGSATGSQISRLIHSVERDARIVLDPDYRLKNASAAHYKDRVIEIGPDARSFFLRQRCEVSRRSLRRFFALR